ncbi:MAG: A/G-specific adenine glycosylase [Prevotella sp.]|nr:A/G-specific adenine glycosylase [Prevotella sp.]
MNFAATLLQWFKNNGRSLPWRETKDAYAIWLSEVILQQTRIVQGMGYWERFMAQWPAVNDLAAATENEVLKAWQGLGYYSRARNLHTAAQQVMELGGFPQTFKELKTLKGVGDYTAAAIASIAFGEPIAVVDGNVYRVLSRYFGIDTPIDSTEGKKEFQALAQSLLPINEPADYNEAIMDFGATQCTPNYPHCSACPLCETCIAFREQRINELPVKSKKVKQRERHFTYLYIEYEGKIAIHQRGAGDIWQGLWEFPQEEHLTSSEDSAWKSEAQLLQKGVKHILTHQILLADIYLWQPTRLPQLPSEFIWIEKQDLENYALPRLIEILLKAVPA